MPRHTAEAPGGGDLPDSGSLLEIEGAELSSVRKVDGVVEVRATAGDTHLGGDDFDRRIVDHVADQFQKENGIDLRKDAMVLQRLKEACERAKKDLSQATTTDINLPFITADASGPKHLTRIAHRATIAIASIFN